jgi:hypothetical protein
MERTSLVQKIVQIDKNMNWSIGLLYQKVHYLLQHFWACSIHDAIWACAFDQIVPVQINGQTYENVCLKTFEQKGLRLFEYPFS